MVISMVNAQAILFCQLSDMLFNYMGSLCLCVSSEPLTTSESRRLSMNKIEQVLSQTSPRTSLISTRCALRWSVGETQTEKVDCAKLFLVTYTCATPFVEQLSSIPSKPLVGDCRVLCNPLLPPGTRIKQSKAKACRHRSPGIHLMLTGSCNHLQICNLGAGALSVTCALEPFTEVESDWNSHYKSSRLPGLSKAFNRKGGRWDESTDIKIEISSFKMLQVYMIYMHSLASGSLKE